jgi:hypothetical protein
MKLMSIKYIFLFFQSSILESIKIENFDKSNNISNQIKDMLLTLKLIQIQSQ